MKLHWKILSWMAAGAIVGGTLRATLEATPWIGVEFREEAGRTVVAAIQPSSPLASQGLTRRPVTVGSVVTEITRNLGQGEREVRVRVLSAEDARRAVQDAAIGDLLWFRLEGFETPRSVPVGMAPDSALNRWLAPFRVVAGIFLALLKMLIVPIVLTSIITGVAGVGSGREFGRLGLKTFLYYVSTSTLAILVGLVLVNVLRPGAGAALGLSPSEEFAEVTDQSIFDILRRMVPENVFTAFSDNSQMLQVIFFALLFGFFITQTVEPHRTRIKEFFDAAFEVMMKLALFVLGLIPYGVFALLVKVVGETGFGMFRALGFFMLTVAAGLVLHACVVLPLLLRTIARVSPLAWVRAMGPALMTAFSTSSSSMTLPVTLESVEKRGKVSNRVTSFTVPLGATINMDGTALYECMGVLFLGQYYASITPTFTLTLGSQVFVVVMALLASIGAAGIPSAGLVMMLTILTGLGLPVEGAALLLAVDRPLDMLRTVVNVWSDSCGAAIIASTEGETVLTEGPGEEPELAAAGSRRAGRGA